MAGAFSLLVTVLAIHASVLEIVKGQPVWKSGRDCTPLCPGGKMCMVENNGAEACVCPKDCPDIREPVCSVYMIEFDNLCELHKFSCQQQMFIAVKYDGTCKINGSDPLASLEQCPDKGKLLQFRDRYMEWIYVCRSSRQNPKFKMDRQDTKFSNSAKQELADWEFENRDLDRDDRLDKSELKLMVDTVGVESCLPGFLLSADLDGQDGINRNEWSSAFNLGGEAIGSKKL